MKEIKDLARPTWYSTADSEEQKEFRDWLRELLRTETVCLTFEKKDGTIREMRCTLSESKLPISEKERGVAKQNDSSMPVFDLDKGEWRAFRFDSIKTLSFNLGE